jgi:hypothetical protein
MFVAALCALAAAGSTASGASADVDRQAAAALAKEKGITVAAATDRLARQHELGAVGERLVASLGSRTGGDYLDDDGNLVVTTLDAAATAEVTRAGARAEHVDDSLGRLESITAALERQAARGGTGGVQEWYVDIPHNSVVVTVTDGASDARTVALLRVAAAFGQTVHVKHAPASEAPRTTEWLAGGEKYILPDGQHTCSTGFNAADQYGRNVVVTAGHCMQQSGWETRSGYLVGARRTSSFPGDDFGTFWNQYPSYWQPVPYVDLYNGVYARVAGEWDYPPVGASVCKSGLTTGFTCGTITAVNASANYDGQMVYGLVRHTACVEPGDSGGANISGSNYYALGMTSGANLYNKTYCLAKVGQQNVSWYQPVGEALSANGLRLVL